MLEYILLISFLLMVSVLPMGRKRKLLFSFWIIVGFSSIRFGMSYDYGLVYVRAIKFGWYHLERFPALLEYLAHMWGYPFFFAATSFFITFFIIKGIYLGTKFVMPSVFFYVGMPFFFIQDLSTIREAMGTSLIFCLTMLQLSPKFQAYGNVKRLFISIIYIIAASLCHSSSVVAVLIFFPWDKINKKLLYFSVVVSLAIGILGKSLIMFIVDHLSGYGHLSDKLEQYVTNEMSGLILLRVMMYAISIFIFWNYDKLVKYNPAYKKVLHFMCVGLSFMGLFSVNPHLGLRLCLYFWMPGIVLAPLCWRLCRLPFGLFKFICICCFAVTIYSYYLNTIGDKYRHFYPFINIFSRKANFGIY